MGVFTLLRLNPFSPIRVGFVGGGAVFLTLAALSFPALAIVVPDDLQLDRAPGLQILAGPSPNPHTRFPCERCHVKTDVTYEVGKKYGLKVPLVTEDESSVVLCEQCHQDYHSFHPVGFPVKRLSEEVDRAGIFPLETLVEGFTKLTCLTCHDIHFSHTGYNLLRGFAVDPRAAGGKFSNRLEFCRACHGKEVEMMSAHGEENEGRSCDFCHLGYKAPGIPGPLKRRLNESCTVCHPLGRQQHFYAYNPFPDFRRDELAGYGFPRSRKRFTCATCHVHHRSGEDDSILRPAFIAIVAKSNRVNPHQTTRFCQNCHPFEPPPPGTAGAIAPLWEEDITRLCRGCHSKEEALRMDHPLNAPSARAVVPAGWPLRKDGTMGCQTCHLAGHGPPDPDNPKWLRNAPYEGRNEVCFRCHREEDYRGRNIHLEVADFSGCELCHIVKERTALRPEGKVGDLLAEPTLLCLLCHNPLPHPASAKHTVKPGNFSFVQVDTQKAPLALGKISCHTCHDSHSVDTEESLLWTAGTQGLICHNCHPF